MKENYFRSRRCVKWRNAEITLRYVYQNATPRNAATPRQGKAGISSRNNGFSWVQRLWKDTIIPNRPWKYLRECPKRILAVSHETFKNTQRRLWVELQRCHCRNLEMRITFDRNLQFDQTKLHLLSDDSSFKMHPKYWIWLQISNRWSHVIDVSLFHAIYIPLMITSIGK